MITDEQLHPHTVNAINGFAIDAKVFLSAIQRLETAEKPIEVRCGEYHLKLDPRNREAMEMHLKSLLKNVEKKDEAEKQLADLKGKLPTMADGPTIYLGSKVFCEGLEQHGGFVEKIERWDGKVWVTLRDAGTESGTAAFIDDLNVQNCYSTLDAFLAATQKSEAGSQPQREGGGK